MIDSIKEILIGYSEENYRKFNASLIPNSVKPILGVRLPKLHSLAKKICHEDWRTYLSEAHDDFFEEVVIRGLIIAYANIDENERLSFITSFIPGIDNWAVCDTFCSRLKEAKTEPELYWNYIQPYCNSENEFEVRFALVMMLSHFISEGYLERILLILNTIDHRGYYVSMAVAWAVSYCYFIFPQRTTEFLQSCNIDDITYRRSLQKIIDSHRLDASTKDKVRAMRKKKSLEQLNACPRLLNTKQTSLIS